MKLPPMILREGELVRFSLRPDALLRVSLLSPGDPVVWVHTEMTAALVDAMSEAAAAFLRETFDKLIQQTENRPEGK